jgi:hypothetical protein
LVCILLLTPRQTILQSQPNSVLEKKVLLANARIVELEAEIANMQLIQMLQDRSTTAAPDKQLLEMLNTQGKDLDTRIRRFGIDRGALGL